MGLKNWCLGLLLESELCQQWMWKWQPCQHKRFVLWNPTPHGLGTMKQGRYRQDFRVIHINSYLPGLLSKCHGRQQHSLKRKDVKIYRISHAKHKCWWDCCIVSVKVYICFTPLWQELITTLNTNFMSIQSACHFYTQCAEFRWSDEVRCNWPIETQTKLPPLSRWHFQMHFLEWKCTNFTGVCS